MMDETKKWIFCKKMMQIADYFVFLRQFIATQAAAATDAMMTY